MRLIRQAQNVDEHSSVKPLGTSAVDTTAGAALVLRVRRQPRAAAATQRSVSRNRTWNALAAGSFFSLSISSISENIFTYSASTSSSNNNNVTMARVFMALVFCFAITILLAGSSVEAFESRGWNDAHATYYGGADASGTQGGACGYGNLYSTGYGTNTAALSQALFNSGLTCGACFELSCDSSGSKYCEGAPSVVVTATNFCPSGSDGGWCDQPKQHFDLSVPVFDKIAAQVGGVIPVKYRRVPCAKSGGIRFTINGNPFFILVLVTNVAGAGDVQQLSVKGDHTDWYAMQRNWGQQWQFSGNSGLVGQALSFKVVTSDGAEATSMDAAPANWRFSQTFEGVNF